MKVALVSAKTSTVDIFPALKENLSKEIAGIEFEELFVPSADNLPAAASKLAGKADLVLVFALFEEPSEEISFLKQKLVDVEIASGKPVLKYIQESELEREDRKEEYIEGLAEKWSETIIDVLFRSEKLKPG